MVEKYQYTIHFTTHNNDEYRTIHTEGEGLYVCEDYELNSQLQYQQLQGAHNLSSKPFTPLMSTQNMQSFTGTQNKA